MDLLAEEIADKEKDHGGNSSEITSESVAIPKDVRLTDWPAHETVVVYLDEYCDEPQTAKQIADGLQRVGREFKGDKPVRTIRAALKKAMAANPNVYNIGWAKYYLRSKPTPKVKQIEKALAKTNGTGGRTTKEHGRRTAKGIAKRRKEGTATWGRKKKLTPEMIEQAKEMLRNGVSLREVRRRLDVSIPVLYESGIRQRELKREGELRRKAGLALGDQKEGDNVVRFAKS